MTKQFSVIVFLFIALIGCDSADLNQTDSSKPSVSQAVVTKPDIPQADATHSKVYTFEYFTEFPAPTREAQLRLFRTALADSLWGQNFFTTDDGVRARGLLLQYANGKIEALNEAFKLLQSANDAGDVHALQWLGTFEQIGLPELQLNENPKAGAQKIMKAAELGDVTAQFKVGFYHELGRFQLDKSPEKALNLYKQASEGGSHQATSHLGLAHMKGNSNLGINQNESMGLEYYAKAIDQGSLAARIDLANHQYANGEHEQMQETARPLCETNTVYGARGCLYQAAALHLMYQASGSKNASLVEAFEEVIEKAKSLSSDAYEYSAVQGMFYSDNQAQLGIEPERVLSLLRAACSFEIANRPKKSIFVGNACMVLATKLPITYPNMLLIMALARKAASEGVTLAMGHVAMVMHEHPSMISIAKGLPLKLLQQSVARDPQPVHEAYLGYLYAIDTYGPKNIALADSFFQSAAKKGYPRGQEMYARFLGSSDIEKYDRCYVWGKIAHLRGFEPSTAHVSCRSRIADEAKIKALDSEIQRLNKTIPHLHIQSAQ